MRKTEVIMGLIAGVGTGLVIGCVLGTTFTDANSVKANIEDKSMVEQYEDKEVLQTTTGPVSNEPTKVPIRETRETIVPHSVIEVEPTQNPSEDVNLMSDETTGKSDGSDGIIQTPQPITNVKIIQTNNPSDGLGEPEFIEPVIIPTVNPSEDILIKTEQDGLVEGETIWTEFSPISE